VAGLANKSQIQPLKDHAIDQSINDQTGSQFRLISKTK
jgi:hypothetical protein